MIGIFQGSPEGRANECQRRAKGGLPRATSKKQGKRRAWEGALPTTGQFGSYGGCSVVNGGRGSSKWSQLVGIREEAYNLSRV